MGVPIKTHGCGLVVETRFGLKFIEDISPRRRGIQRAVDNRERFYAFDIFKVAKIFSIFICQLLSRPIHNIRGQREFDGWDSQVPNEVTANFYTSQRRLVVIRDPSEGSFAIDGFTEARLALGTFLTSVSAGTLIRFGWNLPTDFADARLSTTAYSHQRFKTQREEDTSWSLYGLTGFQGTAVAHNITLDGPVFRNFSTGTHSKPFVGEAYIGFGVRYSGVNFSYVHTYRTKEFEGQDDSQTFGSLTLGVRL